MKPCSNPTCTHQVEDDARFCGMCGAYVGPELTAHTTLIDALAHRIQQCRDLIDSIQTELDEKGKAQKIRAVMNILTSITTDQLPGKPVAHAAEQIQVLSTVVQEIMALPSISPTASAADMQHWPISPLEMRQWTELLIALTGSNKFSSLDKATKSAVRVALGRFISFVGIQARSNPDAEQFLLELYESIMALSVPELQSCFSGVDKGKLFRRLEQRLQNSLSSASPSITPAEVQILGDLASEELSVLGVGKQELGERTRETLQTLEQIQHLGETNAPLAEAVAKAYTSLLQTTVENDYLRRRDYHTRLDVVADLSRTALTMATIHFSHVPKNVLSLLTDNLPAMIGSSSHAHYPAGKTREAVRAYIQLLRSIISQEEDRKEELSDLAGALTGNALSSFDHSLFQELSRLRSDLRK